ncbi:MAG TPA: HEAT repeat domain-containing protein [Longimicrobium sp.]|nr:HEAT repeat domain-containing protein [Longimicrobium sp.]
MTAGDRAQGTGESRRIRAATQFPPFSREAGERGRGRGGRPALGLQFAAALVAALLTLAAPAAAQHRPLAGRNLSIAAQLLRLEDRREYDHDALASAAANQSPEVRRRAVLAIGRIGDQRGTQTVVGRLADTDTAVVASAAFALGLLRDTSAVPALVEQLRGANVVARRPTVAGEAALALAKMPTQRGKQAVEDLLAHAPASGPGVRRAVGEALLAYWRFPRPFNANVATRWLGSADPEIRWRAAYALARRPSPQGTAALDRLTDDTDPLVRSFAIRALTAPLADSAGILRAQALVGVIKAVGDVRNEVSVSAIRTLGTYDAPESISLLVGMLANADPHLAITAAESLGRLGAKAPAAAGRLRQTALDATRPIALRTAALAALAEVDAASAATAADVLMGETNWRSRAAAARVYARAASAAIYTRSPLGARLDRAIADPDGRVSTAAVEAAVGAAGDSVARIRPLLLRALELPDFYARVNAITGLGQAGDPADAPALYDAYARAQRDSMNDAAVAAVDALGLLGKKDTKVARGFFARFGRSGDYLVRQRVATAFGEDVPAGWGAALPILTGRTTADYVAMVRRSQANPRPRVRLVTSRGPIVLALFADDAPLTVDNFLALARRGYFNGQEWPRVVANFVIQGGDPRGDTNGGPGYAIRDEINRHPYVAGTLGMALSGPDTGGSQWFVTHSPQPHLDGTYTVFGGTARGMDVVGKIVPADRIIRVEEVR